MANFINTKTTRDKRWMPEGFDPKEMPKVMMVVMEQEIAEAQRKGAMLTFEVLTDGSPTKPPSMVKPRGKITAVDEAAQDFREAIGKVFDHLLSISPYSPKSQRDIARGMTTHYIEAHHLYVNGSRLASEEAIRAYEPQRDDQIMFVNSQPYATRIERGWSWQAPTGVYRVTANRLKRDYRDTLEIAYTDRILAEAVPGAMIGFSRSAQRVPSVLITARGGDIGIKRGHFVSRSDPDYRDWF